MSVILEAILQSVFTGTSQLVWGLALGTILAIPEYARDRFLVSHASVHKQRIETIIVTSSVAPYTNSTLTITEPASTSTVTETTTSTILGQTTPAHLHLNTTTITIKGLSTYWSTSISTVTENLNQTSTVFEPAKPNGTGAVSKDSGGLYSDALELTEDAKLACTFLLLSSSFANAFLLYRVLKFRRGTYKKELDAREKRSKKNEAYANAKAGHAESQREDAVKALTEERKNAAKASTGTIEARKRDMATIASQDKIVSNFLKTINEMELRENDTERFELDDFKNDTAMEASLIKWCALRERNVTLMQNTAAETWQKLSRERTEEVDVLIPRVQNLTEKFRNSRDQNRFPSTGDL
jgi:hypothetical protein